MKIRKTLFSDMVTSVYACHKIDHKALYSVMHELPTEQL